MIAAIDTDPKFLCALHDRRMIIVCFGACGIFHRYQSDKYQRPEDSHLQLFHDALEFPDGRIVLLTKLSAGQEATVLQLPAQATTAVEADAQKRIAYVG